MNRLQEKYQNSVKAELTKKFGYTSSMQIPKVEKIVVNMGVSDAVDNSKVLD
ncbi:MAG: 50S ribosomal protein L5, partial [Anaeroplasmataceae bacterium]|nr:50S ribosomal protein L5 [Anaeroplasmataceae bacterium]